MKTTLFYQRMFVLFFSLPGILFFSGYTLKKNKQHVDKNYTPPPYMHFVRQALVAKKLGEAAHFLSAARKCWQKRGKACGFHKHTYLIYLGVLALQQGQVENAVGLLEQAQLIWKKSLPKKPRKETKAFLEAKKSYLRLGETLSFYLGQAYFRSKKYKKAVEALLQAVGIVGKMSGYYRLLALAQLKAKYYADSRSTLQKGFQAFPDDPGMLRIAVMLYLEVGAWQAALTIARRLLRVPPKPDIAPFLMVIDAMRQKHLVYQVLPLLEEARLYKPKNHGVLLRLAIAYSQARMPRSAAKYFSTLAATKPTMAYYAASAWMQAHNLRKALFWNQFVPNNTKRDSQRSKIFLSEGKLRRGLVVLQRQWKEKKCTPHERYRLAHVALQLGEYSLAQKAIASLKNTSYEPAGKKLQNVLRLCRLSPWRCLN